MAKQLNAEQKTIGELLGKRGVKFLIPDYQRPYSWGRDECRKLWDDLYEFAFPDENDFRKFDVDEEAYFMGTILTYKNSSKEYEVIDGQQRLVTFMLMLRVFYEAFGSAQDESTKNVRKKIEQCLWYVDEDEKPDKESLKLKYQVIADEESDELKTILKTGKSTPKNKSNYAKNYRLFQRWISDLNAEKPGYLLYLVRRILNNCILLPIEADNENTALRIFTTLNDAGRPLEDSDIFKAQFYKYYLNRGSDEKDKFVARWKDLEELCNKNFRPRSGSKINELFRHYMYYLLAKNNAKKVNRDLRDYYEKDGYKILQSGETFEDLITLANFWDDVNTRKTEKLSSRVLRRLYVLSLFCTDARLSSNNFGRTRKFCANA